MIGVPWLFFFVCKKKKKEKNKKIFVVPSPGKDSIFRFGNIREIIKQRNIG